MEWIGILMAKSLNYRKASVWQEKIFEICGHDIRYECVGASAIDEAGDWYLFIEDSKWREHIQKLRQCSFVVSIIVGEKNAPYLFTEHEVEEFVQSTMHDVPESFIEAGDVVKVLHGFLSNLYGIVCSVNDGEADVFFSFCVKNFHERIKTGDLEVVKHTDFMPPKSPARQLTIGAQVVFPNNIYR